MEILRTPDEQFDSLIDYPFSPNYATVGDGLRLHYVDEGEGPVMLLMHGEPSWSYLYRKMIPGLVSAGFRCLAPDLIGFGKSDKPAAVDDYTYERHVAWTDEWLGQMDVGDVTLFCQDWGGLVGLRLVANHPDQFANVVVGNTGMPTGDQQMPEAFMKWQAFARTVPEFPVSPMIQASTVSELTPDELAAYDAPFPDETYKAGARVFPSLVPTQPDDPSAEPNRQAWAVLRQWTKPLVTAFSDSDPITAGGDRVFLKLVPGAEGQPHVTIEQAGHFLQEDQPEQLVEVLIGLARQS